MIFIVPPKPKRGMSEEDYYALGTRRPFVRTMRSRLKRTAQSLALRLRRKRLTKGAKPSKSIAPEFHKVAPGSL